MLDETKDKELIESWYQEAKSITLEVLPEFLERLMSYPHGYGSICHAIAAGAIAAGWAMNNSDKGGITGFQASAVMWQFIRGWEYQSNKCGMKLLDFDKLLYPQYESHFDNVISLSTWEMLQKEAKEKLSDQSAHPDVRAHWESIASGNIPFKFTLKEN